VGWRGPSWIGISGTRQPTTIQRCGTFLDNWYPQYRVLFGFAQLWARRRTLIPQFAAALARLEARHPVRRPVHLPPTPAEAVPRLRATA
jgi:hypothetical protein